MKKFKEWLSDYLRYILLLIGALLAFTLIAFSVQTWLIVKKAGSPQTAETQIEEMQPTKGGAIQILTEASSETESDTEKQPDKTDESKSQSESSSELTESETETEKEDQESETETPDTVTAPETSATPQTEAAIAQTETSTEAPIEIQTETQAETQPETQPPTEPVTEAPYQPVYLTMKGACYIRSYPDYGDNIIGEYPAGTIVEFLEDVGGWYKVQIDGMIGYMGARFF